MPTPSGRTPIQIFEDCMVASAASTLHTAIEVGITGFLVAPELAPAALAAMGAEVVAGGSLGLTICSSKAFDSQKSGSSSPAATEAPQGGGATNSTDSGDGSGSGQTGMPQDGLNNPSVHDSATPSVNGTPDETTDKVNSPTGDNDSTGPSELATEVTSSALASGNSTSGQQIAEVGGNYDFISQYGGQGGVQSQADVGDIGSSGHAFGEPIQGGWNQQPGSDEMQMNSGGEHFGPGMSNGNYMDPNSSFSNFGWGTGSEMESMPALADPGGNWGASLHYLGNSDAI